MTAPPAPADTAADAGRPRAWVASSTTAPTALSRSTVTAVDSVALLSRFSQYGTSFTFAWTSVSSRATSRLVRGPARGTSCVMSTTPLLEKLRNGNAFPARPCV